MQKSIKKRKLAKIFYSNFLSRLIYVQFGDCKENNGEITSDKSRSGHPKYLKGTKPCLYRNV